MLIDDERQQFLLIGYLLSEANYDDYRLIWCQDLNDGLHQIEHCLCDVVLLDYHWGLTGKDFISRAHLANSRIPIIVMTDGMERDVDRKAISEGASDYLIKDHVNPQVLERTIRYSIERKKIEQHLDHLAHYDHLTDLPNRILFLDRLNQAISLGHRSNDPFTLMYLDLNGFKAVNDNYGHEMGDKLLQSFSSRLQACVRRSDTVARIGGDEFTVLLNNIGSTAKIISLAQKLIENIQVPFHIAGLELSIGCSIGIAVFPDAGTDADILQRHADIAMYQAKQSGTSSYRFFTYQNRQENTALETLSPNELKVLIDDNKIDLGFTPRIDIHKNTICAVEVSPMYVDKDMIASVCNNETKRLLIEWSIEKAFEIASSIYTGNTLTLAFNIDVEQLQSSHFSLFINRLTKKYQVDIENIEFCLLEGDDRGKKFLMDESIANFSNLGACFALSKFGENTLSLLSMHRYNIPVLHIDPSLLNLALKNNNDADLISTLVLLAHRLHRRVVACNIDCLETLDQVKSLGFDEYKGELLGSCLPFDSLNHCVERYSGSAVT